MLLCVQLVTVLGLQRLPAGSQVYYYRYEMFALDDILVHHILRVCASKKEVCFH